jgi:hypothetical protein
MAADITELLKELHKIVNEAIRAQQPGENQPEGRYYDLSTIDLEKLSDEFAKKVKPKSTALQNIRELVERKRERKCKTAFRTVDRGALRASYRLLRGCRAALRKRRPMAPSPAP